jgi:hypothetical protein
MIYQDLNKIIKRGVRELVAKSSDITPRELTIKSIKI